LEEVFREYKRDRDYFVKPHKQRKFKYFMKIILITLLFVFTSTSSFGQEKIVKKVSYAGTKIKVPKNYKANSEYEIENDLFVVSWIYLPKEMFPKNIQEQINKQIENQTQIDSVSTINFISNGGKFTGIKYIDIKNKKKRYAIMASGIVNDQPLLLSMTFDIEPKTNKDLDELMLKFIKL
jgi:hypothetical protein